MHRIPTNVSSGLELGCPQPAPRRAPLSEAEQLYVAGWRDGTARYYNYSGAAVIRESPDADAAIAGTIRQLLAAAEKIASFAGVHPAARPGPPTEGPGAPDSYGHRWPALRSGSHGGLHARCCLQRHPVHATHDRR